MNKPSIGGHRIGGESYAKSIPTGIRFIICLFKELFVFYSKWSLIKEIMEKIL